MALILSATLLGDGWPLIVQTGIHLGLLALLTPFLFLRLKTSPLDKPLLAWAMWNWFSVLWSVHPSTAMQAAWTLTDGVLIFYIAQNVRETALADRVPIFYTAAIFFTLAAGAIQSHEPASFFPNTNLFSSYLLTCVFIPWTVFMNEDGLLKTEGEKAILLALAVLGTFLLIWSGSRTAVIIFFILMGCLLAGVSHRHRLLRWGVLSAAATVLCVLITREKNWVGSSLQERLLWWGAAVRIFRNHPLSGAGIGNFGILAPLYARTKTLHSLFAHSGPLQILSETGLPGAGLAGFLSLSALRWIRSAPRTSLQRGLALGLAAAFAQNLVDYNLSAPAHWMLFSWTLGLACPNREPEPERTPTSCFPPGVRAAVMAALLFLGADFSTRAWRAHVWVERGRDHLDSGAPAKVSEDLRRARRLDPASLEALALSYRLQTRLSAGEGTSHLEQIQAELSEWRDIPPTGTFWKALAGVWQKRGEKERAAQCLREGATVNPLMEPS